MNITCGSRFLIKATNHQFGYDAILRVCNWSEIEELKGKNNIRDMRAVKRSFMYGKIFHKRFLPCRRPQAHINIEDLD